MIDEAWKEHLREMDDLKQSVQAATYEQKDPLLIYKFESFQLLRGWYKGLIVKLPLSLSRGGIYLSKVREMLESSIAKKD